MSSYPVVLHVLRTPNLRLLCRYPISLTELSPLHKPSYGERSLAKKTSHKLSASEPPRSGGLLNETSRGFLEAKIAQTDTQAACSLPRRQRG